MLSRLLLFLIFLAVSPTPAQAQKPAASKATEAEVLSKASQLILDRQYESAFKLLNSFDPKHRRPAIAIKQAELALAYNLRSREYEGFGFVDLKPHEHLDSLRTRFTRAAIRYPFPVEYVLKSLLKRYPNNYKLNRALGDYYYQVEQCECAEAEKSPKELYALIVRHYTIAHARGYGDYSSYYALGYARMSQRRYAGSVPAFKRSIQLRPDYALSHYNLAYTYIHLNKLTNALAEAQAAARLSDDPTLKDDAVFTVENLTKRIAAQSAKKTKTRKAPPKSQASAKKGPRN
jgi:tetratricopeptide (TPR) repeat protein